MAPVGAPARSLRRADAANPEPGLVRHTAPAVDFRTTGWLSSLMEAGHAPGSRELRAVRPRSAAQASPALAAPAAAVGLLRGARAALDLAGVRAIQRTAGNRATGHLISARRALSRVPTATGAVVSAEAQAAATPLLEGMKIHGPEAAKFFSGEMAVGEVAAPGKASTIVFFQLKEGRLRAGIFSINVKGDPRGAVRAFSAFRGSARNLARALNLSEMDLMGAAVVNKDVAQMLENQGFARSTEQLPESLGALPGETIEVYSKRFPVQAAATAAPEAEAGASAAASAASKAAPEAAAAAEEAATAAGTSAAGESLSALAIAGRVAVVAVETVVLAVIAFALEYLRRKAEAERFQAKMKAAQPEIETAVSALDPEIEALERSSSGRTVWVHVTIWITSRDTVIGGMGFMTYDHAFEDAGFERASASLQYVNGRTSTLGRPVSMPFEGGSATSTLRRELVTTSVPVAYNAATLDAAERLHRIQQIEADAKQPDLPSSVLEALFNERDAMKSAGLP